MTEPRLLALGDTPVRLLLAIHLANIISLMGMNTLTLPGTLLPFVYAAALAASWGMVGKLSLGPARPTELGLSGWDLSLIHI